MHVSNAQTALAAERSLVRLVGTLAGVSAVVYLIAGWFTGSLHVATGAIGPATIAAFAFGMLRIGRTRILPVLLFAATIIVIQNSLLGIEEVAVSSILPLAIIGITGAFFVPSRFITPYVVAYSLLIFGARVQWSSGNLEYLQAAIAAIATGFGATLFAWAKREFGRREDRYRNLFEHAPVSLWKEDFTEVGTELSALVAGGVNDLDGYLTSNPEVVRHLASLVRVVDVNDAALRLTEAPDRSLLLGNFRMETFSRGALESFIPQFLAAANGTGKTSIELKGGLTMTGRPIEALLVWSAPTVNGEPDLANVTVAIVDVTRQREAERKLQDLIDSKDQFVATISHELRTPLTAVIGIATELRDAPDSISEAERHELLGLVVEQSMEVSRIVDDLLVVARAEAGNLIVASQPVDLAEEARGVVQTIDPDILFEVRGHPTVTADPQRVRQIIRNMVTNAKRYGGPDVRVVVEDRGRRGLVEVRDNGAPLPTTSRSEIFEPYTRAKSGTGVTASVGLGLTVSRELARHMGGNLTYDHDGDEAIFAMTLVTVPAKIPVA
jgi:signal transduction histidine kinase